MAKKKKPRRRIAVDCTYADMAAIERHAKAIMNREGWRRGLAALLWVFFRLSPAKGHALLTQFLSDGTIGW